MISTADIFGNGGERHQCLSRNRDETYTGLRDYPFPAIPLILDVLQANADKEHQYDYPIWYNGHFVSLNFPYAKATNELKTLGTKDGYQHLWLEAWGQNKSRNTSSFTFVNKDRFYTISIATTAQTEMKMLRLGANDPDFNLRNETAFR